MTASENTPADGRGRLYGLGIGPGDPELITVKALRLLQAAHVLAYPAPDQGDSLARQIVSGYLDGHHQEFVIRMPMSAARFPAQEVYDRAAQTLGGHLDAGRDVVVLCEGDPFFYGSFMYLFGRMAGDYEVDVVPGVSSLMACAAILGSPLAARDDVLAVVPATLPANALRARLTGVDAAAIVKVGRHFSKVREVLVELGLMNCSRYVERATMDNQRILDLREVAGDRAPYFSMILVHNRGNAWHV